MLQHAPRAEAGSATPRQVLPATTNPRPFRQALMVDCNINHSVYGANLCLLAFDAVPVGRLLQIEKITCVGGSATGAMILFNTLTRIDAGHLVGFSAPPFDGAGGSIANGPYYFRAGEKPTLAATASGPDMQAFCSMSGTIWQTS
jgi:hypothetical protein